MASKQLTGSFPSSVFAAAPAALLPPWESALQLPKRSRWMILLLQIPPVQVLHTLYRRHLRAGRTLFVIITIYVAYRFLKRYLPVIKRIREDLKLVEKLAKQMTAQEAAGKRTQLVRRREEQQHIAQVTIGKFARQLVDDLQKKYDVDGIRQKLAAIRIAKRGDEEIALWNEFKEVVFSRLLVCVYAVSILNCLLRVQLAVVSRYIFHDSVQEAPSIPGFSSSSNNCSPLPALKKPPQHVVAEVNRLYLALSTYAQTTGVQNLSQRVNCLVRQEFQFSLQESINFEDFSRILCRIALRIEADQISNVSDTTAVIPKTFAELSFPSLLDMRDIVPHMRITLDQHLNQQEPRVVGSETSLTASQNIQDGYDRLLEMIGETDLIVNSNDFHASVRASINAGQQLLLDHFQPQFGSSNEATTFVNIIVRAAKLLNVLLPANSIEDAPLLQAMQNLPRVQNMCDVIFFPLQQLDELQQLDNFEHTQ